MNNYYFNVIIYDKISLRFDSFTYFSDFTVDIGDMVEVPFGKKNKKAIVYEYVDYNKIKKNIDIKKINKILIKQIIKEDDINFIKWISIYFAVYPFKALKLFLPEYIFKKLDKSNNLFGNNKNDKNEYSFKQSVYDIVLSKEQRIIADKILSNISDIHLIYGIASSGKTYVYLDIVKKVLDSGGRVLILVPEVGITSQIFDVYKKYFYERCEILHSFLTDTKKFDIWKKCFNGEIDVLISTRIGLFYPLKNLKFIIVDEYHDMSFYSEQKPAYNIKQMINYLNKKNNIGCVYVSATPDVVDIYRQKNIYRLDKKYNIDCLPDVHIVDMRLNTSKSHIAKKTISYIKETLENKGQVFIYHNQRGVARLIACTECGFVFKCKNCDISLVYHRLDEQNFLLCHQCGYVYRFKNTCPHCSGYKFKILKYGIQQTEQIIKDIFSNYNIVRIDSDSIKNKDLFNIYYHYIKEKKYDIVIGTNMITKGFDFENVNLVVVINYDTSQYYPFFNATEKNMQTLFQLIGRTNRYKKGKVVIQTYNPESDDLKYFVNGDYDAFLKDEIKYRKHMKYPPYMQLINYIYTDKTKEKCIDYLNNIKNVFENTLNIKDIYITPCFVPRISNKYYWQLFLKVYNYNEQIMYIFNKFRSGKLIIYE